jgi:hypothetical protein
MLIGERERARGPGFRLGAVVLLLGIAIGLLADPSRWLDALRTEPEQAEVQAPEPEREVAWGPPSLPSEPPNNGLPTLDIQLAGEGGTILQRVRDRALDRGVIVQGEEDTVDATVTLDGKSTHAEVRIKGDWLDHVETDKWSLRVRLRGGKLRGMSTFSVQAAETRGFLWEWLVLHVLRREGVLAPRATFVNVVVDGVSKGVYYLEEHFSKELLESAGRREGPIVALDESLYWAGLLRYRSIPQRGLKFRVSRAARGFHGPLRAELRAFGEKRLSSVPTLSRQLWSATEKLRDLQDMVVASRTDAERASHFAALERARGARVEDLFDVHSLARVASVASLFQVSHGLIWHNMRFYHDPVRDRLEPVQFDNMADLASGRDPVVFRPTVIWAEFNHSPSYYREVFRHLGTLTDPDWLDEVLEETRPELELFQDALAAEGELPSRHRVDAMIQRLRGQQNYLRDVVVPPDPVGLRGVFEVEEAPGDRVAGDLVLEAWATSAVPVVVEGFRFQNGAVVTARSAMADGSRDLVEGRDGVVLHTDGRPVTFRFPLDDRLANLEGVQALKSYLRDPAAGREGVLPRVEVLHRPIATEEVTTEEVRFLRAADDWRLGEGRPPAPTVGEVLERHPFLSYRSDAHQLHTLPGVWEVEGDLVLPAGAGLVLEGGTALHFEEGAVLLVEGPLECRGTENAPVTLMPLDVDEGTWGGLAVIDAGARSQLDHTWIVRTRAVERGGWVLTGGTTFYRSPVTLRDVHIEGSQAEDALNVVGTDCVLERVRIVGAHSDSFDGDFVTAYIADSEFLEGLGDGIDFSGSSVQVERCRFRLIADKAVSAGESTEIAMDGVWVEDVGIGIASKDSSLVHGTEVTIRGAQHYALAAYVKKPEFGPSRLELSESTIEGSGLGDAIAQEGCAIVIDGGEVEAVELDVGALYRAEVLGR